MRTERDIVAEAEFILRKNATVRQTAEVFRISKSTVHLDVTERLKCINPELYRKVKMVLRNNKQYWYIKGGMATREKYRKLKLKKES